MTNFKKLLLAGTAVVAIGAAPAFAATEVTDGDAITATDATGLTETGADSTITVNSNAGAITLGADGTESLLINSAGDTLTVNQTTSGTANGVIYADDITETAGDIVLNVTNDDATFQGSIDAIALTVGSSSANPTIDLTFDTANNENLTIAATITAVDATDTVNIAINNTDGNGNTIDFTGAIGTSSVAVDTVAIGGDGTASDLDVTFQNNLYATAITLGDSANGDTVAVTIDTATDGTDLTVGGTIDGDDGTDTTNLVVVDTDATTGDTVTFTGNIGATNALTAVTVGNVATGGNAVFNGTIDAATVTVGAVTNNAGTASADFNGGITGNVNVVASTAAAVDTTATIAGDVTGNITLTDAAGNGVSKVTFDGTSAQTVTGTVNTTAATEGQIIVANAAGVTFESAVGATGLDVFTVNSGAVANLEAALNTQGVGITNSGTLNIDVTGAAGSVTATAAGDITSTGTINVSGTTNSATIDAAAGTLTIDGVFSTEISTAAQTTTLGGNTAVDIGTVADTTITAGNQIVLADATTIGAAGRTNTLNIKKTATFDPDATTVVTSGANITLAADSTLNVGLDADTVEFDDGATITAITSAGGTNLATALTNGDIVLVDTAFIDLADNTSDATNLNVILNVKDASTVLSGTSYNDMADKLLQTITSADTTGGLETARGNVQGAATAAAAQALLEGMAPNVDGSAQAGVVASVTNSALGLTGDRLASLRTGDQTGMAAGNMTHGLKVWGQAFGTTGTQDSRDGVSGYDVDTWGLTVGVDTQTLADDWVWGLAFTYADTAVDSDNSVNTQVDLDTYQIALYGDYKWDAATYINGQIGYGMNKGDQSKTNVGGTGLTANADVDSDVFFARLEAGRDYDMDNGWTLTPIANLNYQHISSDGYTETGTCGTLCLTNVDVENMNSLEAGLGAEASYLHQMADGSFLKPKLHAAYRYDFIGDEVQTTGAFSGVSATRFTVKGFDAQQNTFNVGAGLSFYSSSNFELSANYDYELKEDYDAHNGYIRAGFKF